MYKYGLTKLAMNFLQKQGRYPNDRNDVNPRSLSRNCQETFGTQCDEIKKRSLLDQLLSRDVTRGGVEGAAAPCWKHLAPSSEEIFYSYQSKFDKIT